MFMCVAAFVMFLGYFQGETKTMVGGAVALVVTFVIGSPDVMTMLGFDGEAIEAATWGAQD